MSATASRGPSGHQEVWELLPWHATRTLAAAEAERVEAHLARCALCRRELEVCRSMASVVRVAGGLPLAGGASRPAAGADAGASSVPSAGAVGGAPAGRPSNPAPAGNPLAGGGLPGGSSATLAPASGAPPRDGWWSATPRAARRIVLVQAAVLGLVALALAFFAGRAAVRGTAGAAATDAPAAAHAPGAFRTLADPAASAPAGGDETPAVRLVLREEAAVGELNDLLAEVGGRIVAGPSKAGVYTVRLDVRDEPAPGAAAAVLAAALERLRRHPAVVFAEPVVVHRAPGGAGGAPR